VRGKFLLAENIGRIPLNSKINANGPDRTEIASLAVKGKLKIPFSELELSFSRSSGPGGQNVNKTSTRVEVRFRISGSRALSEAQKRALTEALGSRIDKEGWLRVVEQRSRSQARNRELALRKLGELLRGGLKRLRKRIPTRPSRASQERRIQSKRHKSETKRLRGRVRD